MEKINPKEVRIGNYVTIIGLVPVQVTWQHIKSMSEGDNQYRPILITEQWLLMFGFEKTTSYEYYLDKVDFPFYYDEGNVNISPGGMTDDTFGIDISCIYIHSLQNLYFALTGEELVCSL